MIARIAMLLAAVLLAAPVQAQEAGGLVGQGRGLFRDQGCYGCHTVGGGGPPPPPAPAFG
jgi:mono/diheme cytochrome c family protein